MKTLSPSRKAKIKQRDINPGQCLKSSRGAVRTSSAGATPERSHKAALALLDDRLFPDTIVRMGGVIQVRFRGTRRYGHARIQA